MEFDKQNDKGENFVHLYTKFNENESMKKEAEKAGVLSAVQFDKSEKAYRLYEHLIPEGANAKPLMEKFATPEAEAAAKSERAEFEQKKAEAAKATGLDVKDADVYVAARSNGDRDRFNALKEEKGSVFTYSAKKGGYVHKSGPKEGFEYFQSDEAKAAWAAEGEARKKAADNRRESASSSIDVVSERANGRAFLADNVNGFKLPLNKEENKSVRDQQIEAMKSASNEELSQVYKITQNEKTILDRRQYAIQIKEAQKSGVSTEDFNKMSAADRRKAANYKGLNNEDFSKMVALGSGFFAIRDVMIERGLIQSRDSAKSLQNEQSKSSGNNNESRENSAKSNEAPKNEAKSNEAPKNENSKDKAEENAAGNKMAAQLAAGAASQGVGR